LGSIGLIDKRFSYETHVKRTLNCVSIFLIKRQFVVCCEFFYFTL